MTLYVPPANADTTVFSLGLHSIPQRTILPQRMPSIQLYIYGSISDDLIVVQPLPIDIEQDEDGTFVVSDDIFLVYGSGENREEAFGDYIGSLRGLYRILENGAKSNQYDHNQFVHLGSFIRPKSQRGYDASQANRD